MASFSLLFTPKPINGTARLGCSIVASECYRAAHSDPFVGGQNTGAPGTKRTRHCRSVLVQRGVKYFPEGAASAPPNVRANQNPLKKATWHHINAAFVSFSMSRMQFYVTDFVQRVIALTGIAL